VTHDCFGNPTPGIPPSISDDFASIERWRHVPFQARLMYHYARTDAMIGRLPVAAAWDSYYALYDWPKRTGESSPNEEQ
jgi:hypothetical protein